MNRHSKQHPDSELLDQLRAGLLDDQPTVKSELEAHLAGCEHCRQLTDWQQLAIPAMDPEQLEQRLAGIRQTVLATPVRPVRRYLPLAAAASLIVALGSVLLLGEQESATNQELATARAGTETIDLYEDLDFYLWMADHKTSDKQSGTQSDRQG